MDRGREESRVTTVVVSSGSGSATISKIADVARWLRVVPTTENDEYDITITDGAGRKMFERLDQVGTLAELIPLSLFIASTATISNATADGNYQVIFDMH